MVTRSKSSKKKVAKKAVKKTATKKVAKKKATKKATKKTVKKAVKTRSSKATSAQKRKVSRETTAKKKTTSKKAATKKKAPAKKVASKKTQSRKSASAQKSKTSRGTSTTKAKKKTAAKKKTTSKKKVAKKAVKKSPAKKTVAKKKTATSKKKATSKKVAKKAPAKKKTSSKGSKLLSHPKISKSAKRVIKKVLDKTDRLEREEKALEKKLDQVLSNQKALIEKEKKSVVINNVSNSDEKLISLENKQLAELKKLEELEREIQKYLEPHPLMSVGVKDVFRGFIGALVGVAISAPLYMAANTIRYMTVGRSILFFVLAFIAGFVFLYLAGFKDVEDKNVLYFLPVRLIILYLVSLLVCVLTYAIMLPGFGLNFNESLMNVALVILPAIIGACTGDLMGKD